MDKRIILCFFSLCALCCITAMGQLSQAHQYSLDEIREYVERLQSSGDNNSIRDISIEQVKHPQLGEEAIKQLEYDPMESRRNESLGMEATRAGYGSSRWDTFEYYPGMDLERKRAVVRNEFIKNVCLITIPIALVLLIVYFILKRTNNNIKEDNNMGLFTNLKKGVVLANIADAHDAAYRCFDTYEQIFDINCLKTAAWYIKAGVIDLTDKYSFSMMQPIRIQVLGTLVDSTIGLAVSSCVKTLLKYMEELEKNDKDYIQEIMDGGKAFREVEYEIPHSIRKKYDRSW